jgi:arginine repressor
MKKLKKVLTKKPLSQKEQILKKLKIKKSGIKQSDFSFQISRRISELLKSGHKITKTKNKNGIMVYRLG